MRVFIHSNLRAGRNTYVTAKMLTAYFQNPAKQIAYFIKSLWHLICFRIRHKYTDHHQYTKPTHQSQVKSH